MFDVGVGVHVCHCPCLRVGDNFIGSVLSCHLNVGSRIALRSLNLQAKYFTH